MTDITYRVANDYLIPNLIMDGETGGSLEEMIGKYGLTEGTIVEVKNDKGSDTGCGRLKSGVEWINLVYAKRV